MLQAMRIRDIGWDPVCLIPAWFAIVVIDHLAAVRFPALAIGHDQQATPFGALVNLALVLVLLFWPGGDFDEAPGTTLRSSRRTEPSAAADRLARVSQGTARPY
jgi:hypothetical protein